MLLEDIKVDFMKKHTLDLFIYLYLFLYYNFLKLKFIRVTYPIFRKET